MKPQKFLFYIWFSAILIAVSCISPSFAQTCQSGDVICPDGQTACCEKFKPHCKDGEAKCCKKKKDGSGYRCKDKEGIEYPVQCKDNCYSTDNSDDEDNGP